MIIGGCAQKMLGMKEVVKASGNVERDEMFNRESSGCCSTIFIRSLKTGIN